MIAGGADLGSGGANHDVATVAAFPNLDLALLEDLSSLHILQQGAVALLVVLLNGSHQTELSSQFVEALCFGSLGKAVVHIRPLVVLALSGMEQILGGVADAAQLLEPHLGMLLLVVSGLQEQRGDLLVTFLLGLGSKVGILISGHGFAGKGSLQVLLGLGTCVLVSHDSSSCIFRQRRFFTNQL